MALLKPRGSAAAAARPRADIRIRVRQPGGATRMVVASGHLDEVQELAKGGTKLGDTSSHDGSNASEALLLVEAALLGEGAFSRVSEVTEATTNRTFALKRMTKTAALQVGRAWRGGGLCRRQARTGAGPSVAAARPARPFAHHRHLLHSARSTCSASSTSPRTPPTPSASVSTPASRCARAVERCRPTARLSPALARVVACRRLPLTNAIPPDPPLQQDPYHLYFLFDLMSGGDLMDVLVAEAKIIKFPVPQKGSVRQGLLAPKVKMWQVRRSARAAGPHGSPGLASSLPT
jgi:hypothetical protein